jgi:thiol-disulfide isomerase/thioredoxin
VGGATGSPYAVIFLAHWCPHCQAEVPRLVALSKNGQIEGVDVTGVATATSDQNPNYPPSEWLTGEDWPFPVMVDTASGTAANAYGLTGYPYMVFVDAEGKVVGRTSGEVGEEDLQKIFKGEVGLGTQATRAQIIETLITRRYVNRDRNHLVATEKGCLLIDQLRRLEKTRSLASPEETARWEMELEKIAQGVGRPEAFVEVIREFVEAGIREFKSMSGRPPSSNRTIGQCPACGGEIIEGRKGFGCKNWRPQSGGCRFVVWKEISGRSIDVEMVRQLLTREPVGPLVFRSADGGDFTASLVLERQEGGEEGPVSWTTRLLSADKPSKGEGPSQGRTRPPSPLDIIGRCPRCGGQVIEGKKGYGCANWRPTSFARPSPGHPRPTRCGWPPPPPTTR